MIWRSIALFVVVTLLAAIGGFCGYLLWKQRPHYEAYFDIRWGSLDSDGNDGGLADFRALRPQIFSASSVQYFVRSSMRSSNLNTSEIQLLTTEFGTGETGQFHDIEHKLLVDSKEMKGLPDISRQIKSIPAVVRIAAYGSDQDEATRRAKLFLDYVTYAFARTELLKYFQNLSSTTRNDLARYRSEIARKRFDLQSVHHRLASARSLRDHYKEDSSRPALIGENETLMLQSPGSAVRYLSPTRQVIGLEAEAADLTDNLQTFGLITVRAERTSHYTDEILSLIQNVDDPREILSTALEKTKDLESADGAELREALQVASTRIKEALTGIDLKFLDKRQFASEPTISGKGPARLMFVGAGILIVIFCTLLLATWRIWLPWLRNAVRTSSLRPT